MRVLLTGANGQLGSCFQDRLPHGWTLWATDNSELDITDRDAVSLAVAEFSPDVILNAAAYTAVDKAEEDHIKAVCVNKNGPENLALAAERNSCLLIHISTDYVFDGQAIKPYAEDDHTNPLSVYGQTKLDGELAVINANPQAIIVRTAWVFSEYGNNFVKTMIRLGKERNSLSVVSDQFGCPTYAGDIASAIITLIKIKAEGGIYHFCGDKSVPWSDFAKMIFAIAFKENVIKSIPLVEEITTEQYPTPAKRPKYSILNCSKINGLGIQLSDWEKALFNIIKKI